MDTYKVTVTAFIEAVGTREAIQLFMEELELATWDKLECTKEEDKLWKYTKEEEVSKK